MRQRKYVHSCKVIGGSKRRLENTKNTGASKNAEGKEIKDLFDKYYRSQVSALYRAIRT